MRQLMKFMALAILCVVPAFMMAQEVASLTGTVTDTTGAVVQGVKVTLLNTRTNTKYEAKTNEMGLYNISNVLPGPGYKLTFEREGFEKLAVNDLYLIVGATRTQNAQLKVGAIAETMEVSAVSEGVALNTSDASVGSNFSMNTVSQLPVQFRDSPTALMQLQPGVVGGNVTGGSDGIGSRSGAVTGARGDQNNVTLDGLDVNDFATGQAFSTVANAPVDSIQEFRGETAGSLAASGRGSGAQVQMVTKSGTNQFHGSVYEFHRNTATAANSWFNNQSGVKKPALLRNFFGASIGGPVLKDKLFFFFNYQGRRDARSANAAAVVPLDSFRNGNVSYIKATDANGNACNFTSRQNTTPGCIGTLDAAQIAAMDPQGVGVDSTLLQFLNDRYPHANDLTGGDGVNTGYFRYTTPVGRVSNDYVSRIDYNMNDSMKLFGRFSILRDEYGDSVNYAAPIRFPGDPLTKSIRNTSYAYVIGHTWTMSPTLVNQFNYGETVSRLDFPTGWNPNGTTYWQIGGSMLSNPYYSQSEQGRRNPIPVFRDDLTWQKGNHNIQIGGTFKPIKTESYLNNDNNFVTLGLGGRTSQLNASLRPTDLRVGSTASTTYDRAFALMLGRFASVGSNYNHDSSLEPLPQGTGARRSYRYWETEAYLQDTWKVTTDLTLTYGIRYQYYSVPYEVNGVEAIQNLGFDELLAVRNTAGLAGVSGDGVTPITYYDLGGKANGARGLYEPNLTNFAPRFSFAYSPKASDNWFGRVFGDKKTVLRGGAGIVYDHPVANALNFIQDQNSYMFQSASSRLFGATSANDALLNDPRFTAMGSFPTPAPAPTIDRPFAPFVSNGVPHGTVDNEFNYAIDPGLKTPYSILFNFGFQRELPHHFVLEASYVGRLGRRLIAQADASQLVDFKDNGSGQLMSAAFANLTGQVRAGTALDADGAFVGTPVPWFENQIFPGGTAIMAEYLGYYLGIGDIADSVQWMASNGLIDSNIGLAAQFAGNTYITNKASSNYHGLLMSLHKNMSNGLQFDLNYTFSHSIDNASGISNSIAAGDGMGFICDARNLRICRGNSDFDVTHMINGNFIYDLPFGKGKTFASGANGVLDRIIGGWSLSGIPTWRTGIAFSPVTGAYLMGYANNAPAIFNGDRNAIAVDVHQESDGSVYLFKDKDAAQKAFTSPYGFTMGSRNILRGPSFFNLDLGIAKNIPINERFKLQFRADSFNSLNHPSFALPGGGGTGSNADVNGGTFGQITGTSSTAREMQFSLRLEF